MKILVLRFDAPLSSFGAPVVDQQGVVQAFPALSMLTGLIGNALGWEHRDADRLAALQDQLRYASRADRRGELLEEYQTVDLGSDWMRPESAGWTTRGHIATRGGANAIGTHQRYPQYWADSIHTVTIALNGEGSPPLERVADALQEPARPLFIGRKCCLPAAPILLERAEGESAVGALAAVPRARRADPGPLPAWWCEDNAATSLPSDSRLIPVTDERDWRSRVHVGRRFMREGLVNPPEAARA